MRKILPILLLLLSFGFLFKPALVLAADPQPVTVVPLATTAPGQWQEDNEVTFAGKNAKRSGDLLDWVIRNYQWASFANQNNPFLEVWKSVSIVSYALLGIAVLVGAFLIIITRGQNIGIKKFVIRLVLVVALIALSFALVQFTYQIFDIIQGFFLRKSNGQFISSNDLLSVAFDYSGFKGLRIAGAQYDESAFISLLLVKLTAASYYAMFLILIIRKIILWFFIMVSPLFALLLLFSPLRNSAKIWAGEFFRWVLYGPLFAIFLSGMVTFWTFWGAGTPLNLDAYNPPAPPAVGSQQPPATPSKDQFPALPCDKPQSDNDVIYPTAINILIGGPCQVVGKFNNVNVPSSFIEYVVALLMIWMVILMPFILLKIFLDYLNSFNFGDSKLAQYVAMARNAPLFDRGRNGAKTAPPGSPPPALSTGMAKQLPIGAETGILTNADIAENMSAANTRQNENQKGIDSELARSLQQNLSRAHIMSSQSGEQSSISSSQANVGFNEAATNAVSAVLDQSGVLNLANLSIPTMVDIAKFETSLLSSDAQTRQEASKVYEALNRVAGTSQLTTPAEHEQYSKVTEKILQQATSGNNVATAVLSASAAAGLLKGNQLVQIPKIVVANYQSIGKLSDVAEMPDVTVDFKVSKIEEGLQQQAKQGNPLANALLASLPAGDVSAPDGAIRQQAFLNHYEAIAKITALADQSSLPEEQRLEQIKAELDKEAKMGNPLAVSIISVVTLASKAAIPEQNLIQKVNLDDYEQVRQTWVENYRNLEVPAQFKDRQEWLKSENTKIPEAIDLLVSTDVSNQAEGKKRVSQILPFLLLGGFSKSEIVAYLKAKNEAAKQVKSEVEKSVANEDTMLDRETKTTETPKAMMLEAQVPETESANVGVQPTMANLSGNNPQTPDDLTENGVASKSDLDDK